jgi:hypothetical protein
VEATARIAPATVKVRCFFIFILAMQAAGSMALAKFPSSLNPESDGWLFFDRINRMGIETASAEGAQFELSWAASNCSVSPCFFILIILFILSISAVCIPMGKA